MKQGLVVKSTGSWFKIEDKTGEIFDCKIKGNFRIKDIKSTNPLAVGDYVKFTTESSKNQKNIKNTGWVISVEDRKNYIVRRSPNLSKRAHIIAANVDQAILLCTISHPVTTTIFIDRYLASAAAYRIPVIIVFNKTDLYNDDEQNRLNALISIYSNIGYKCLSTSAKTMKGIDDLILTIKNKTNVINGHSGVGKSTLINLIHPKLKIKTSNISEMHKTGKHTTAFSEMHKLPFGGYIIDTPGIKGFGMLDMEAWEISHYFPEIFKYSHHCKYNNCYHKNEPGCAVIKAVREGNIAESRYISYLGLMEPDEKYRKPY